MAPRETEDNAYAKFWGGKQRALWYVMVFRAKKCTQKRDAPYHNARLSGGENTITYHNALCLSPQNFA